MRKRFHIPKGKSRRQFRRASGPHPRNMSPGPMRGGIRL